LLDAVNVAERLGLPPEAVLASSLETAVNLLPFERGVATATLLEQLASVLRERGQFEFGWVLEYLNRPDGATDRPTRAASGRSE
jgi:hypothetical protein